MCKIFMLVRKENEIDFSKMYSNKVDVEIFVDVVKGLQAIKEYRPKLILIDLATSRISGIDLIKIIRSNPCNYHTKIIITAKNFNVKTLENTFNLGADYFIKYPFSMEDIEKIYDGIKYFDDFTNIESIASSNNFDWSIGI